MKKRLLLTLLTLCLAVVAMTMVVCADDTTLYISGLNDPLSANSYIASNSTEVLSKAPDSGGYLFFDGSTLYLYDFEWETDKPYFIYSQGKLTIALNGKNTISTAADSDGCIDSSADLTFTGSGSLTISTSGSYAIAIRSEGNITISGCTVTATATATTSIDDPILSAAIWAVGNLTIENGSTVTATATSDGYSYSEAYAIFSYGDMQIEDSIVNAEANASGDETVLSYAIYSDSGVIIKDCTEVKAEATSTGGTFVSESRAIYSYSDDITISNSTVTAEASAVGDTAESFAIRSRKDVDIENSTVNAYATADGDYTDAYSIYLSGDMVIDENSTVTVNADSKGPQYSNSFGIYVGNSISIASSEIYSTVNASGETGDVLAILAYGAVTIKDDSVIEATVSGIGAYSVPCGIATYATAGIVIEDSALKLSVSRGSSQGDIRGLYTYEGDISITSSEFITDGGIYTYSGDVTVTADTDEILYLQVGKSESDIQYEEYIISDTVDLSSLLSYSYISITQHEHTYDSTSIVWNWESDYSSATATVTCADCGTVTVVEAVVTSSVDSYGNTTYVATISDTGSSYTDTQTVAAAPSTSDEPTTSSKSDIYTTLSRIQASYTAVQAAIEKANSLNPDDYENFSAVTEAIEAVDWNLNVLNQKTVNAYAEAIEEAIENLVPVSTTEEVVEIEEPVEAGETDIE